MVEPPTEANPISLLRSLETRAIAAAAVLPEVPGQSRNWRGIGFKVAAQCMVVEMGDVREVLHLPRVARVPGTKSWMRGLASLRGALLPIVDLAGFLADQSVTATRESRVLVIQESDLLVGLQVEEVFGLQQFANDAFVEPPEGAHERMREFVVGSFATADIHWQVFDVKALLRSTEFLQAAA